jgi:hypothetical protein
MQGIGLPAGAGALSRGCGVDVVLIGKKGAKMVSQMVVSGSKNAGPPWFLKCILYLGSKAILYYTSSTIGDNRSSVNRQEGPSFLLIKRLGGKKTYETYVIRRRWRG